MTFGIKPIEEIVGTIVANPTATALEVLHAAEIFCTVPTILYTTSTIAGLSAAADNKGRFVFIADTCSYRYSDGTAWTNDFSTVPSPPLWAWGQNGGGQLGDGTTVNKSSPGLVVGGFTDWCQVSDGGEHSLVLRTNGTAWAWGDGNRGKLGDGTTVNKSSPVSVVGGFTDWCRVSAGSSHSLGVRTNGTAWAWGYGQCGRLGDGTVVDRSSPVSVVGGFTDWCQISASNGSGFRGHSLGVRTNGTLWAWGFNNGGRLGDGTATDRSSPVSVVGGFTNWCQVSAGGCHSLGVRTNGTLWAWGINFCGVLGDGTVTNRTSPVSVVGGFTDWCQVSTNGLHSIGVRTNSTAWSWGQNTQGRLGDGTTVNKSSPVSVVGGFTDWCQVEAGGSHSLAIRTNGTAWAWGLNSSGQLGNNGYTSQSSPVSVVGGFTDWCQVSAGTSNSVGIRSSGGFTAI